MQARKHQPEGTKWRYNHKNKPRVAPIYETPVIIPDFNIVNSYGLTNYDMARSMVLHYALAQALTLKSIDLLLFILKFCHDYKIEFSIFVADNYINVRAHNSFFDIERKIKFKYNVQQKHYYHRRVAGNPYDIAA